jgi:hypothetical protein
LHQRSAAAFEATVTELMHRRHSASGTVRDFSKSGICIDLPFALKPGDVVQMDMANSALFGHIVYSHPDGPLFRTGIEIMQVLLGDTDLAHLLQSVLNETMPGIPGAQRVIA